MHFRIGFVILIMHARNWPFYSGRCFIGFTSSWSIHLQGCPRLMEYLHFFRHCYATKVVFPVTLNAKIMPPPPCKSSLYAWKHLCVRLHLYSSPCVIQYSDSQWTTESSGAPLLFFFSWLLYQSCNYSLGCRKVSNAGTTVCEKFIAEIVKNVTRNFLFRPISCRGLVMCVLDLGQHVGLEKQWGISSWLEFTATQLWLRPRRGKP